MIFNMVGSGGGVPLISRSLGQSTADISALLTISDLNFEPVFLIFKPVTGTSSSKYFMFDNFGGEWRRYYDSNSGYIATNVYTTSNSITVDMYGHDIGGRVCNYLVMGYQ